MNRALAFGLTFFSAISLSFSHASHSTQKSFRPVRIAVIDTGVDIDHAYLKPHIWINRGEVENNGLDDDGNGFVDDVNGWNFVNNDPNVGDRDGHGTHVSGIIKTSLAASSMPVDFQIVPIKYYDRGQSKQSIRRSFLAALRYAVNMGVDIINISAGGPKFLLEERELLQQAADRGIVVVAAAGNKKPSAGHLEFFPAAYRLPNIISVVAAGVDGNPLPTSNLIPNRDLFFVFGKRVQSSLPNNTYGFKTGSSQAAAFMTGQVVPYVFALGEARGKKPANVLEHFKILKKSIFEKSISLQSATLPEHPEKKSMIEAL